MMNSPGFKGRGSLEDAHDVPKAFGAMLEKAFSLFAGLRDVGPFGMRYQTYFQRTFEVYTRLWRYQQQFRTQLEASYSLKRSDIGDIASQIGQLYYHYYLRTSDRSYLKESAVFYEAILQRRYYEELTRSSSLDDWRRLLRYYARYIVVSAMQRRHDKVQVLASDLGRWVTHYITHLSPPDAEEWLALMRELGTFAAAARPLSNGVLVLAGDSFLLDELHARDPDAGQLARPRSALSFQQCILVGCQTNQIKFSELTLDMLRMMGMLERVSLVDEQPNQSSSTQGRGALEGSLGLNLMAVVGPTKKNPVKHLLYRPTAQTLLGNVHQALKELTEDGALFLYISADSWGGNIVDAWSGGVLLAPTMESGGTATAHRSAVHAIFPGDIVSMTRKPCMLVFDCDSAHCFQGLRSPFGMPVVSLLSPEKCPAGMERARLLVSPIFDEHSSQAQQQRSEISGSLFTLFLSDPCTALARLCHVSFNQWPENRLLKCAHALAECLAHTISELRAANHETPIPPEWLAFAFDDFAALLVARFCFCRVILSRCVLVPQEALYLPTCTPELPSSLNPPGDLLRRLFAKMRVDDKFTL